VSRRGPVPKPAALRVLTGNPSWRPISHTAHVEPGLPTKPGWLSGVASGVWNDLGPELVTAGLLTPLDGMIFAVYCELTADLRELAIVGARDGLLGRGGAAHRVLKAYLTVAAALRLTAAELGMSPASRCRIKVTPPQPKTALERFQEKHGE